MMKVALAVENFGQQRVPYGLGEERLVAVKEGPDLRCGVLGGAT